jgi:hypothetical protein
MKVHPVGAWLFHADGRTDMKDMKLIVAFRNSASTPKMLRIANIFLLQASKAIFLLLAAL